MSRRRRCAKKSATRAHVAWAKVLRRRVRAAGAARAATAATAAAVTLAGAGTAFATPSDRAEPVGTAAATSGASPVQCPAPLKRSGFPADLAVMGRTLFFTADDSVHGRELWKSDGTAAGTVLVKNINPNEADRGSSIPRNLTVMGGTLFFTADDGTHGRELWKSDGTRAGTVLVKNINPGTDNGYGGTPGGSHAYSLTAMGGQLFFAADDGTHGSELWRSDGSRAGTVLVKDIAPKDSYYARSYPSHLTAMGGRLFFAADDGTHGRELWKSDGTRAGTVLVKDIDPDDYPYFVDSPSSLTVVGGRLFFTADDGTHGEELWKSDGTRAGTVLVKDIDPAADRYDPYDFFGGPSSLTAVGGRLFFAAFDGTHGRELWKSDGSRAGTVLVKDIRTVPFTGPGGEIPVGSYPSSLTAMRGRLFFAAGDGTHREELWKSDGTRAGTVLVKIIDPVESPYIVPGPSSLTAVGGRLFFAADDGAHGKELWKSDGTRAGTVLVKDINPCSHDGLPPDQLTAVGGRLFFSADDGVHGKELWTSDGSRTGTVLVKDIKAETTQ